MQPGDGAVRCPGEEQPPSPARRQVPAAIMNGGGIRDSVEPGSVRLSDVLQIHPFGNTVDVVTLRGETLRRVFEHSVSAVEDGAGHFLQVSGEVAVQPRLGRGVRLVDCAVLVVNKGEFSMVTGCSARGNFVF